MVSLVNSIKHRERNWHHLYVVSSRKQKEGANSQFILGSQCHRGNAGKDRRRDAQTRGQQIVCRNRARESSFPALQPAEDLLQLLTCTEVVQKAAAVTCKGVSVARSEHQWAGYVSWAIVCWPLQPGTRTLPKHKQAESRNIHNV